MYQPECARSKSRDKCLSGIRMGAPGLGTKVGLLRVGEQKWASQGWDEKGGCQGCAKKRVLKAHAGRKMLPRLAQLTQGMANLAISWVVMRFRWPKQRIGGLNKASLTRAQPARNPRRTTLKHTRTAPSVRASSSHAWRQRPQLLEPSRAKRAGRGEGVSHSSETPREACPFTAIDSDYSCPAGSLGRGERAPRDEQASRAL